MRKKVPHTHKNVRYAVLLISVAVPVAMVFIWNIVFFQIEQLIVQFLNDFFVFLQCQACNDII